MKKIYVAPLRAGDEIQIISLAQSEATNTRYRRNMAIKRLEAIGYVVSFGKNAFANDEFDSSTVSERIADFESALRNPNVKMILAANGGYNSNQLLDSIDIELVKKYPKPICGYSDITAIQNALYARTGVVSFSGPLFSTFGVKKGFDYTLRNFAKVVASKEPFTVTPSKEWSDDNWEKNQSKRRFIKNEGPWIMNPGVANGTIIGGNLCTLNLLHGTASMPSLNNTILFIEEDDLVRYNFTREFERNLTSLLQQPGADAVRGAVFGRFQKKSQMSREVLQRIIENNKILRAIPIIANADFGHTSPQFTFPIGGEVLISVGKKAEIRFTRW